MPTLRQTQRREAAAAEAWLYGGVLSRRILRSMGIDRHAVSAEVSQHRWRPHGSQTIAVHTGALSTVARHWRAVWEVGDRIAVLDGVSALQAAGLTGFDSDVVHVSVPHGCSARSVPGVRTFKASRLADEIVGAGIPRVRPALATIRAAQRASTDRQAALLLVLPVQQRLVTGEQLQRAVLALPHRGRTAFIRETVRAVADGAQSLGELDFGRHCVRRGLPRPERQVVVRLPSGRVYLDVRWSGVRLVVEIDGSGHREGLAVTFDNLRQNAVTIRGEIVLRIDLVGYRLAPDAFMDQVCEAYHLLARAAQVA